MDVVHFPSFVWKNRALLLDRGRVETQQTLPHNHTLGPLEGRATFSDDLDYPLQQSRAFLSNNCANTKFPWSKLKDILLT
jgi:hypothetical protein